MRISAGQFNFPRILPRVFRVARGNVALRTGHSIVVIRVTITSWLVRAGIEEEQSVGREPTRRQLACRLAGRLNDGPQ